MGILFALRVASACANFAPAMTTNTTSPSSANAEYARAEAYTDSVEVS